MRLRWLLCWTLLLSAGPVLAHPVPRRCHERKITAELTSAAVIVRYRLEVDTLTIIQDDLSAFEDEVGQFTRPEQFYDAFIRSYAPILARNVRITLDGRALELTCTQRGYRLRDENGEPLDHLRCDFVFQAAWQPTGRHEFTFNEGNYPQEIGRLQIAVTSTRPVEIISKMEPELALQQRPPQELGPGDDGRLRRASAVFRVPDRASATIAPAPPMVETPRADERQANHLSLLDLLLDPHRGVWVLLMLAAAFGAVHALTPGHGKTLVAAYLVGERGTFWHAFFLGVVTTCTHTGAVLGLAVLLMILFPKTVPADVQTALGLIGGLLVAGLGFWLLLRRLGGGADHFHLGGHGHHHEAHTHEHFPREQSVGIWGLIVLGISGGIVPCWDAVAMLAFAISAQRLWLAVPLLLAFSAGLAGVLIAIGLAVVYLKGFSTSRWGQGRLVQSLPLLSAVLVTGLGLWLCYESVHKPQESAAVRPERP